MMAAPPPDEAPRDESRPTKLPWRRPKVDVIEIWTATQQGGNALADQDPNQPS